MCVVCMYAVCTCCIVLCVDCVLCACVDVLCACCVHVCYGVCGLCCVWIVCCVHVWMCVMCMLCAVHVCCVHVWMCVLCTCVLCGCHLELPHPCVSWGPGTSPPCCNPCTPPEIGGPQQALSHIWPCLNGCALHGWYVREVYMCEVCVVCVWGVRMCICVVCVIVCECVCVVRVWGVCGMVRVRVSVWGVWCVCVRCVCVRCVCEVCARACVYVLCVIVCECVHVCAWQMWICVVCDDASSCDVRGVCVCGYHGVCVVCRTCIIHTCRWWVCVCTCVSWHVGVHVCVHMCFVYVRVHVCVQVCMCAGVSVDVCTWVLFVRKHPVRRGTWTTTHLPCTAFQWAGSECSCDSDWSLQVLQIGLFLS